MKEAAVVKKKKRAEKARRKHGREMEIARWVRAGENQSDIEAELESKDPMEMGDDVISSDDEGGWEVVVSLVERHEPVAASAGGRWEAKRRGDVPAQRKRTVSLDAIGELEAKWTRSPRPLEASLALSPPAPGTAG